MTEQSTATHLTGFLLQGGSFALLALVLAGGAWVAWKITAAVQTMQASFIAATTQQQADFTEALRSQRENAQTRLDATRSEDLAERRAMRDTLDRNTAAIGNLTAALVTSDRPPQIGRA